MSTSKTLRLVVLFGLGIVVWNVGTAFAPPTHDLTVGLVPTNLPGVVIGIITALPSGWSGSQQLNDQVIKCGFDGVTTYTDCYEAFSDNQASVTLTIYPNPNFVFLYWDAKNQECANKPTTISVTMSVNGQKECNAIFSSTATLTVNKVVVGAAPGSAWSFTGTTPIGSFTLPASGGSTSFTITSAGSYTVTETTKLGYSVAASCTTGATGTSSVTVALQLGQSVTCTFTNTLQTGTIVINKTAVGGNGTFSYTSTIPSNAAFNITTTGGSGGQTFNGVTAGSYTVTESGPPSGWSFTSLSCSDPSGGTSTSGQTATIGLAAGETVTCTFTNTKRATLIVQKVMVGGTDTFSYSGTPSGSISTNNGTISASVVPGQYSSTETVPAGWDLSSIVCDDNNSTGNVSTATATFNAEAGETVTCTFTNTKRGHLVVQKTTDPSGDPTVFTISASGSGTITGGGAGTVTDATDKDYEVTPGTYSVSETVPSGWDKTGDTCQNVTVAAGQTVNCTITNRQRGTIVVVKNTAGSDGTFSYTSTIPSNAGFNITTSGGTGSQTFNNVTAGSYTVTESGPPSGWDFTSLSCSDPSGGTSTSGQTATIGLAAGETVTCTFTNTKLPTLTVTKTVITDNGGTATVSDFTLKVDGTTVTSGTPITLSPGTYTVSETGPEGYSATFGGDCNPTTHQVTLAAGDNKSCTITNDDDEPSLTLVKAVVNDNGGTASASAWTLTATGPTGFSGSGPSVSNGASFDAGTYTLSESGGPSGYTASSWVCVGGTQNGSQITLALGQSATCTITNDDVQPQLTVTKVVVNDNGGTATEGSFTLQVDGAPVSSGVATGFNAGTYSVGESGPMGYTATFSGDCSTSGIVTLAIGDVKSCTITNDDDEPSLTLVKVVVNDNGGTAQPSAWTLTATGPTGFSGSGPTVSNGASFDAGTYTLTESGGPSEYTASGWSCVGGSQSGNQITLTLGQSATCTITNDDQPATLIVIKHVVNDNGGNNVAGDWTMSVSGTDVSPSSFAGSESGVTVTLDAGSYSVDETGPSGYARSDSIDCAGTIGNGQTKTCTITNDDIAPQLTVIKHVVNDNGGNNVAGDWTMSVSGAGASPSSFAGSETGVVVTLNANQSFSVGESGPSGYSSSTSGVCSSAGLDEGALATCIVTNDDQLASIIIAKNALGGDGTFGFTISGPSSSTQLLTTVGGIATTGALSVNAGSYTVSEVFIPTNWLQIGASCNGGDTSFTLPPGGSVICTFDNQLAPPNKIIAQVKIKDEEVPPPGEEMTVQLIFLSLPDGLSNYELIFNVGDASAHSRIARIESIESKTIEPEFFQVIGQQDFSVRFKALDAKDKIRIGDTNILFAELKLRILLPGRSLLSLINPGLTIVDDRGQVIERDNLLLIPTTFEVK